MNKIKVLIACEYSGIIREAFKNKGCDVISCDLLPTEIPGKHYQGNVLDILYNDFDLMIASPPCTYLSYAGNSSWNLPGRLTLRLEALIFFAKLWEAPIKHICIENPRGCASPAIAKYSQIIQPYYFGDNHIKTTCLWLKNLPKLTWDQQNTFFNDPISLIKPNPLRIDNTLRAKKRYFCDAATRSSKKRSKFWNGIAAAMADQWISYLNSTNETHNV